MLTHQCKVILKKIKTLTGNTECEVAFLGDTTLFCLSSDYKQTYDYSKYQAEINSIISHLVSTGYLRYGKNENFFFLTQKGVHKTQLNLSIIGRYMLKNLIAFIALIVAIIGLLSDLGLITIELMK